MVLKSVLKLHSQRKKMDDEPWEQWVIHPPDLGY